MKYARLKLFCTIACVLFSQSLYPISTDAAPPSQIVFTSTRDGNKEIYIMNSDGSRQENLTRHREDDFDPAWSPDGKQILFVSTRDGVRDLYLMNADGRNVARVFRKGARREQPAWAPDGKMIVYAAPEEHAIKTASIAGRSEKRVAWIDWGRGNPAWSPNGSEIAYDWGGGGRIRLLNLRTDTITVLLPDEEFFMGYPAWAPTGDRLAFACFKWPENHVGALRIDDKLTLYIADRGGAWVKRIVKEPIVNHPTWSPDGSEILYEKRFDDRRGERQLFKVSVETGRPQQLTRKGSNYKADWMNSSGFPVEPMSSSLTTVWGEMKRE